MNHSKTTGKQPPSRRRSSKSNSDFLANVRSTRLSIEQCESRQLFAIDTGIDDVSAFREVGSENTADTSPLLASFANSPLPALASFEQTEDSGSSPPPCPSCGRSGCTAHIFADGNIAYAFPAMDRVTASAATSRITTGAFAPLNQTFNLSSAALLGSSSLASATKTIYLDFTGHRVQGTPWNSSSSLELYCAPFSIDASPTFSDNELIIIQQTWARVSEIFSPFQINVTTREPSIGDLLNTGGSDVRWGMRVVISDASGDENPADGSGGVAFLSSFGSRGSITGNDTPCFVNTKGSGISPANLALVAAHEVGHTLGLNHHGISGTGTSNPPIDPEGDYYAGQGSGVASWGPIMGAPYGQNLVQWSHGEYATADRPNQDDLEIITTTSSNGFGYRADTVSDTFSRATPMTRLITGSGAKVLVTSVDALGAVTAASIASAGSKYRIGDLLKINGSGGSGAWFQVVSVSATTLGEGSIASLAIARGGSGYTSRTTLSHIASLTTVRSQGFIEKSTDTDVYSFTVTAGQVDLQVRPFDLVDPVSFAGANLDVGATLYSSDGRVIATMRPTDQLDATYSGRLPSGLYYIRVQGTGNRDPLVDGYSNYGSLGQYTILVDGNTANIGNGSQNPPTVVVSPTVPSASIRGPQAAVVEGSVATFVITLSEPLTKAVTVGYRTVAGTAVAGRDFVPSTLFVTFAPGDTSETVDVETKNDITAETDEQFSIQLVRRPGPVILGTATATATIAYNDGGLPSRAAMTSAMAATARLSAFNAPNAVVSQAISAAFASTSSNFSRVFDSSVPVISSSSRINSPVTGFVWSHAATTQSLPAKIKLSGSSGQELNSFSAGFMPQTGTIRSNTGTNASKQLLHAFHQLGKLAEQEIKVQPGLIAKEKFICTPS